MIRPSINCPPTLERTEIVLNHRVASYPNLLHLPVLYNIIAGGQTWAHAVSRRSVPP
jgi:hypothetical protein